jgi:hypothetical protein
MFSMSFLVLGSNTHALNHVYEAAQEILQNAFGMELVELQTHASLEHEHDTRRSQ